MRVLKYYVENKAQLETVVCGRSSVELITRHAGLKEEAIHLNWSLTRVDISIIVGVNAQGS